MRCPKCGYISFDHLENCLKCKKEIKGIANGLTGSVHNVAVPVFLTFETSSGEVEEAGEGTGGLVDIDAGGMLDEHEISDPDLDILLDEDDFQDREIAFDFGAEEDQDADDFVVDTEQGADSELPAGEDVEEEEGISLDFGDFQFESDDFSSEAGDGDEEQPLPVPEKDLPPELSDISDLDKPKQPEPVEQAEAHEEDDIDLDFDLDLDFGLDDDEQVAAEPAQEPPPAATEEKSELEEFSLDDLDLNLDFDESESEKKPAVTEMADEEELNFDLDLGDLDLDLN